MLHAEVHAVADVLKTYGETLTFEYLLPQATPIIVELHGDTCYDDAPPCPKCNTLLRAVGVRCASHSTRLGIIQNLTLDPPNSALLSRDVARIPFRTACDELDIDCERLRHAEGI